MFASRFGPKMDFGFPLTSLCNHPTTGMLNKKTPISTQGISGEGFVPKSALSTFFGRWFQAGAARSAVLLALPKPVVKSLTSLPRIILHPRWSSQLPKGAGNVKLNIYIKKKKKHGQWVDSLFGQASHFVFSPRLRFKLRQ